jgi:ribose/xylose/arabinose/galactoside ABC-type transport system permease subunit
VTTTDTVAPPAPATLDGELGDERLAYRGVFQRLFIRPEIGAMIGVVGIWTFFWAVAVQFGTVTGGAVGLIEVTSTLGIMAVAVSMLMVGGEFDLSAGAMTGAMGILVILFSLEVGERGGAGLNLWFAIPLSLAVALGIGYLNGWLVERTKLPSFTITLGTYYVLIGAKLGFAKLIVDQVQVGDIRDAKGYNFWWNLFSNGWQTNANDNLVGWNRNEHVWGSRDTVYLVGCLLAIALAVVAAVEMSFSRRTTPRQVGLPVFGGGLVATVAGVVVLHRTDSVAGNVAGCAVIALGTLIALVGYGTWRFEPIGGRGTASLSGPIIKWLGAGVVSIAVGMAIAALMDSRNDEGLFFPFTHQGFRATMLLLWVGAGVAALFVAASKARRVSVMTKSVVTAVAFVATTVMAFFVQNESKSVKFRSEAFSVILGIALFVLVWLVLGLLFDERKAVDSSSDRLGRRLLIVAGVAGTVGMLTKILFVTPEELEAEIAPGLFSMRTVWFIAFSAVAVYMLGSTRFGSWTFAVGGNKEASRQVGVPAARTKTQLFMIVSFAAWLVGMLLAFRLNTIQANTGNGEEFDYIIAAVVGGTLLTGGYGTALGGVLGAAIVAMAGLGIPASRWNSDWRFLFLGVILLTAMLANRWIRTKAEGLRR